jgi:LmbE family N-acetylglucosaminyl deacetylase
MTQESESLDRVMVIAAHPDDPEFACGGTIAKWADNGKQITYLLLTSGDKGSKDGGLRPNHLADLREAEQRAAAKELGVQDVIFLRHPDGLLENNLSLRRQLAGYLRHYKPHIVLAIDPWRHYQLHPDHRAAGEAAMDAVYAAREWNIFPEQLTGDEEPWRVKEAYLFWTDHADHYEDVSETIDRRVAALACHASQVGDDPEKLEKLDQRVREGAQKVGEDAGLPYAEAFKSLRF